MKKIALIYLITLLSLISYSQVPGYFNYQAVVRNAEGELILNTNINYRISILEGSITGWSVFEETQLRQTNNYGISNLVIGAGDFVSGDLTAIDWGSNKYYLKVEADITGGDSFVHIGTVQLLSVPYALYANDVANKDDADADATNEIQDLNLSNDGVLTITNNSAATPINLAPYQGTNTDSQTLSLSGSNLTITNGNTIDVASLVNDPTNELQNLTLSGDTLSIENGNSIVLGVDSSAWLLNNNDLYFNSGKVGIGTSLPNSTLEVKADISTTAEDTLFSVKDKNGNVVFAVFNDGVKVYVNEGVKGNVGGFAVSGRGTGKASEYNVLSVTPDSARFYINETAKGTVGGFAVSGRGTGKNIINNYLQINQDSTRIYINETATKGMPGGFAVSGRGTGKSIKNDYLQITPDSTRIYINETATKGMPGGFAVSGRGTGKGIANEYLQVTPDSTRIYFNDGAKGTVGGFAVSGRGTGKATATDYFNISGNMEVETVLSEARVLWYPKKEAFMAGRVIVESPDSVGTNSWATGFESKAIGDYSQALGYYARAYGNNSTAIGNRANVDSSNSYAFGNNTYISGINSYAIGNGANVSGEGSYAIGSGAKASGNFSFAFGSDGVDSAGVATNVTRATADYAYALGMGSLASNNGAFALGTENEASGYFSTAIGYNTKASGHYGSTAIGYYSTAIGNYGATALGYMSEAQGDYSTAIGIESKAIEWYSVAIGEQARAEGTNAVAIGKETVASGNTSTAIGSSTEAIGGASIAMGHMSIAQGNYSSTAIGYQNHSVGAASVTLGYNTIARGFYSTAMGRNTIAKSYGETVVGLYNDTTQFIDNENWEETDPIFVIGNGKDDTYRTNALMVLKSGNTGVGGYPGGTGLNVFAIKNGIAPELPINNGILLYSEDDASSAVLKVMDEAGNASIISPHSFILTEKSEPMAWSFYSENKKLGYKINVDMLKAIRTLEELSGKKLVYLEDMNTKQIVDQKSEESLLETVKKQKQEIELLKNENVELNNKHNQTLSEIEQLKIEIEKLKEVMNLK